jgi:hypothetical protein
MAPQRPKTLQTLPPDGVVLEDLISSMQDEYGTPTTPQEYRLLIKTPSTEGKAPPREPEDPEEAPQDSSEEAPVRAPRRRRRGRRGRGGGPRVSLEGDAPDSSEPSSPSDG